MTTKDRAALAANHSLRDALHPIGQRMGDLSCSSLSLVYGEASREEVLSDVARLEAATSALLSALALYREELNKLG